VSPIEQLKAELLESISACCVQQKIAFTSREGERWANSANEIRAQLAAIEALEQQVEAVRANEQTHKEYAHMMQEQRSQIADHCRKLEDDLEHTRRALEQEVARCAELEQVRDSMRRAVDDAQRIARERQDKIAELEQDRERLDWLEENKKQFMCTSDACDWTIILPHLREDRELDKLHVYASMRAAIDAARKEGA